MKFQVGDYVCESGSLRVFELTADLGNKYWVCEDISDPDLRYVLKECTLSLSHQQPGDQLSLTQAWKPIDFSADQTSRLCLAHKPATYNSGWTQYEHCSVCGEKLENK